MPIGVLEGNCQLDFMANLDAVVVQVLDALAQLPGQIELLGERPAVLTRVLNHITPVILSGDIESPR